MLPQQAKGQNRYYKSLVEQYPEGLEGQPNSSEKEFLEDLKEHLIDQEKEILAELKKNQENLDNLIKNSASKQELFVSSTENCQTSGLGSDRVLSSNKRKSSGLQTECPPSKKQSGNKSDSDNNGKSGSSGDSSLPPCSPGTQGGSSTSEGGPSVESSNSDLIEASCSDSNQIFWLNLLINIIKAFCGDEDKDYMD
uniref:Uncharacterized protein n=1 Tax=Juglanconis sp. TaxID=2041886 RepID=A0A291LJ53_9PEZI|nr:hypothetical protein [Juglanconis sp.]